MIFVKTERSVETSPGGTEGSRMDQFQVKEVAGCGRTTSKTFNVSDLNKKSTGDQSNGNEHITITSFFVTWLLLLVFSCVF